MRLKNVLGSLAAIALVASPVVAQAQMSDDMDTMDDDGVSAGAIAAIFGILALGIGIFAIGDDDDPISA